MPCGALQDASPCEMPEGWPSDALHLFVGCLAVHCKMPHSARCLRCSTPTWRLLRSNVTIFWGSGKRRCSWRPRRVKDVWKERHLRRCLRWFSLMLKPLVSCLHPHKRERPPSGEEPSSRLLRRYRNNYITISCHIRSYKCTDMTFRKAL